MSRLVHARRVRHRLWARLRRGKDFLAFLAGEATRLTGTGATSAFTTTFATDIINSAAHGLAAGDGPFLLTTTITLPAGYELGTLYWFSAPAGGTLQAHRSYDDAVLGINVVAITDDGTGVHTYTRAETAEGLFADMKEGASAERIRGEADIDNL